MLVAIVRRGKKSGISLFPHRYKEDRDRYHVSLTKAGPPIPLADDRDIPDYLANGYSLAMSKRRGKLQVNFYQAEVDTGLAIAATIQLESREQCRFIPY